MQKNIFKYITMFLAIALLVTIIAPLGSINQIFAKTYNVAQSRYVANVKDFPLSYQDGLAYIKKTYPNATFIYYDTGLDWYKDLLSKENELSYGLNLVPSSSPSSWKRSDEHVEPGWCQASDAVIKYYMDPRNFFTKDRIFQFMSLAYDESQTVERVQTILDGSFMGDGKIVDNNGKSISYAKAMYQIGKETGVSPYLLACRARQEQGTGGSVMISGNYSAIPGYYNYYNMNAYGATTAEIITNGLTYAKKHGWDTPYKSIRGGAQILAANYVDSGKNCLYLQHWNVVAKDDEVTYVPYMTSIQAPSQEAINLKNACTSNDAPYVFIIPVYKNMPDAPGKLPGENASSDNYLLKSLTIDDGKIDIGEFSSNRNSYCATVDSTTLFANIKAQAYSKKATFAINGKPVDLNEDDILDKAIVLSNGFNDITITVTAENEVSKDYFVSILKDDGQAHYKSSVAIFNEESVIIQPGVTVQDLLDNIQSVNCAFTITYKNGIQKGYGAECASDDIVVIKDNDENVIYQEPVIVHGDVNSDGYVTTHDIEMIKSHILDISTLNNVAQIAADVDNDGKITVRDLGLIKALTDDVKNASAPNLNATIVTESSEEQQGWTSVKLDIPNGAYYAEGYLIYDEGKIEAEGIDNSGLIHFIADGSNVLFDNGCDYVSFSSALPSGSADIDIVFEQIYDYSTNKNLSSIEESETVEFVDSELNVSLKPKKDKKGNNYIEFIVTNVSSQNLTDISLNFNQHLKNNKSKNKQTIDALSVGESVACNLNVNSKIVDDLLSAAIDISYTRDDGVEKTASVGVTLEFSKDLTIKSAYINSHNNCVSSNSNSGHHYVYESNNDATINANMTETGICDSCGHQNIKVVDGTKKQVIEKIEMEISSAYANHTELPTIVSLDDTVDVAEIVWTNASGENVDVDAQDFVVLHNETYVLSKLVLTADSVRAFNDQTVIFINGQQFIGQINANENEMTLISVGQFKF